MKITWLDNHRYNTPEDTSFMINELDEKQAEIDRLTLALRDSEATVKQLKLKAAAKNQLKKTNEGIALRNINLREENDRLLAANRDVMIHWEVLQADYKRLEAALNRLADEPFSDILSVKAFVCSVLRRGGE